MCPFEAMTSNFEPRYFLIVLASAGDSTTTSVFRISFSFALSKDLQGLRTLSTAEETRRALYYYVLQGERQERGCGLMRCALGPDGNRVQVKRCIRKGSQHNGFILGKREAWCPRLASGRPVQS